MEDDKGSLGGGAFGGGTGDGGGERSQNGVALPSCGDRKLFHIELRPGETTIVSWKRLIKEAKACPPPGETSLATDAQGSHDNAQFGLDGSSLRPKDTMLEKAIRELEKIIAESKSRNVDIHDDGDTSTLAIKRRLPLEVKQKLAKVARLAQSGQGKISEDLINRLMSIVGHLVHLRTLKRNLREMVLLGLSAKREKAERLNQIKEELAEMIKLQPLKQDHESIDDFQDTPDPLYAMDSAVEDKICDLHDLYDQGMDEDKRPSIRKLYVELAELWLKGEMDNHGIRNAICRAKERRRVMPDQEKVKENRKKKLKVEEITIGEANLETQPILALPINATSILPSTDVTLKEESKQQLENRVKSSLKSERNRHKITQV